MCTVSEGTLQNYYDRKVVSRNGNYTDSPKFVSSCDLTSIIRTTQSLVGGFNKFISTIATGENQLSTTRTHFEPQGIYWVLGGTDGILGKPDPEDSTIGKRAVTCEDVLVFSQVLHTLVANPGVWNMLNIPKNHDDPLKIYKPQVANSGFVTTGRPIADHPPIHPSMDASDWKRIPEYKKDSWAQIADMTFTRIRLGIMDQPQFNCTRTYVNEIMNNGSRSDPTTAHESFDTFLYKTYTEPSFGSPGDPLDSSSTRSIQADLITHARVLVDILLKNCRQANLSTDPNAGGTYAFPALREQFIDLPEPHHCKLFYILFGETIARLICDLKTSPVIHDNKVQNSYHENNKRLASNLGMQLGPFLFNLTTKFFDTSMHVNLIDQLQVSGSHTSSQDPLGAGTGWGFDEVYTHLEEALLALRNTPSSNLEGTPTEGSIWKVQVSASVAKTRIANIFRDNTGSSTTPKADKPVDPKDDPKDEAHARLVFQPYLRLHSQLAGYKLKEIATHKKIPFADQVTNFYENRMLLIRICEEQLHLIQRNSDHKGDFEGSAAWELLFEVFRFHRQSFAEMKEPPNKE